MGKLTRPLGIMISAISITTFRQIHYLLAGLPSRTAKRCSRMERERKTLNSAVLPTEKLTLWVILFLSKSQAFISSAFTPHLGGRTWATYNIEHNRSISLLVGARVFSFTACIFAPRASSSLAVPNFTAEHFLPIPCNIQDFNIPANSIHGFQTTIHRKFRLQNKGFFHTGIFKQQGPLWSCIMPSSFIQNKILHPVISAARP